MKTIRDWNGLSKYGIIPLTGEADRTGQRMLCDLTCSGKEIVCDLLGLDGEHVRLHACYNGRGAGGSMMLPYNLFNDLAAWCLLVHEKCDEVFYVVKSSEDLGFRHDPGAHGYDSSEETLEEWNKHIEFLLSVGFQLRRIRIRTEHPGEGTRAEHMMSGRIT